MHENAITQYRPVLNANAHINENSIAKELTVRTVLLLTATDILTNANVAKAQKRKTGSSLIPIDVFPCSSLVDVAPIIPSINHFLKLGKRSYQTICGAFGFI